MTAQITRIETLQIARLGQRFVQGDAQAYGELYQRLWTVVVGVAMRVLDEVADAEDVAQDAFMRAWAARESLRQPERVRAWILRIAANLARTHRSRQGRFVADGQTHIDEQVGHDNAESMMQEAQQRRTLRQAIGGLTPRQCQVISLRVERELSFKEIAGALGCSSGSARVNYTYGVRTLRQTLAA